MVYAVVAICVGSLFTLSFLVYDLYVQKSGMRCSILELKNRMEFLEKVFDNKADVAVKKESKRKKIRG